MKKIIIIMAIICLQIIQVTDLKSCESGWDSGYKLITSDGGCVFIFHFCWRINILNAIDIMDRETEMDVPCGPEFIRDSAYWVPGPGQGWGNYFESVCSSWQCIYPSN